MDKLSEKAAGNWYVEAHEAIALGLVTAIMPDGEPSAIASAAVRSAVD
jgi:hypothetical protein